MNRLIERMIDNEVVCTQSVQCVNDDCFYCENFRNIRNRLAAYEDTGLESEELQELNASDTSKEESSIKYYNEMRKYQDELKYYKNLEEQGLLIKLPCKVGDTVYVITTNFIKGGIEKVIEEQIINGFEVGQNYIYASFTGINSQKYSMSLNFVFLTREEAEKALEANNA